MFAQASAGAKGDCAVGQASELNASQPKAPLGSQLTASELDALGAEVLRQLTPCWNIPAGARDAAKQRRAARANRRSRRPARRKS